MELDKNIEPALEKLQYYHAFNKLNKRAVEIIGEVYDIDAFELCKKHGIIYEIN